MKQYRFKLEKYSNPSSRHTCPRCNQMRCFVRYVDTEQELKLPHDVGRCNREDKCGYHYTPHDYFKSSNIPQPVMQYEQSVPIVKPINYISNGLMLRSCNNYEQNNLFLFLSKKVGDSMAREAFMKYLVGTAKHWDGATIFWQVDTCNRVRTGKVMLYDLESGSRVKQPHNHITWVHSLLKLEDYNLRQSLFGEHLLRKYPTLPIALVESEKSAVVASCYLPQYLWLATGGKNNCFNLDALKVLEGRKVVLFPDLGATEFWREKIALFDALNIDTILFDFIEKSAPEKMVYNGCDIADFLLTSTPPRCEFQRLMESPLLRYLIAELDLEITSE